MAIFTTLSGKNILNIIAEASGFTKLISMR